MKANGRNPFANMGRPGRPFRRVGPFRRTFADRPVRLVERPILQQAPADGRRHQRPGAEVPGDDRRRTEGADAEVPQTAGRRRNARRPAGRGLCRLPRGRPPLSGHAALRRADDRRHRAASRQHRRNGHRRRQDARGHAAGLSQRPGGQGRSRRHGQRLPGPPRHGMDGPALHVAGPDGRRHPERHGVRRAAKAYDCDITYGTNNEFGFDYLRDNMRSGGPGRQPLSTSTMQQVAGPAALRHHRRGGQHPDRRGPHAADHLRPGPRRRDPLRQGRHASPGN